MECIQSVCADITWVGSSDRRLERFENLFPVPDGVMYNAYVIQDEKTALIDTVDSSVSRQFVDNVRAALAGRPLDYIVVNHMEPDHCANIDVMMTLYPDAKLVGNAKTFQFFQQFYAMNLDGRTHEVKEGDILSLGKHSLQFVMAPMVHWPEVMMCYDSKSKILFSADAFGSFGGYTGSNLFADQSCMLCGTIDERYLDDARRYYSNIVGKYGSQVQAVLKKAAGLDIEIICSLHGPIWRNDLREILDKYQHWSRYIPEKQGVIIAYASMYGNTEEAAIALANELAQRGIADISVYDISKTHASYIIADVFKYSHVVLAAPTYNMGLYYPMHSLIHEMAALNIQDRDVAIIGNGTWAPASTRIMKEMLAEMKNMRLVNEAIELRSAMKPEQQAEIRALADALVASIAARSTSL